MLKKELGIRFDRGLQVGRLQLMVINEGRYCEGVVTPQSEADYRNSDAPMTFEHYVRGFCGPSMLKRGSIAILQTIKEDGEIHERVCCLECLVKAGVLRRS